MKCVDAIDHDECAMDCPSCHDVRMIAETPWSAYPRKTRPKKVPVRYASSRHRRGYSQGGVDRRQAPQLRLVLGGH